jgi:hypothetical protein
MSFFRSIVLPASGSASAISFDSDAATYFAAVVTAGGAALDIAHKVAIHTLVSGLKTDSLWTRLDRLWLFANQHATAALLDVKGLDTATAVNSPTFTADQGYAGNGTSSYINTTYNASTDGSAYTQNSAHIMVYDRTSRTSSAGLPVLTGAYNGSTTYSSIEPNPGGTAYFLMNDLTALTATGPANVQGAWITTRTSNVATAGYRNGSSFASTGASSSVSIPNFAFYVGARNNNGTADSFTSDQIAVFTAGASLDATQAANLNTRIEAYMDALGTGVQ